MRTRIPKECAEMVYDLFDAAHNGTLDIFEFAKMVGNMERQAAHHSLLLLSTQSSTEPHSI